MTAFFTASIAERNKLKVIILSETPEEVELEEETIKQHYANFWFSFLIRAPSGWAKIGTVWNRED